MLKLIGIIMIVMAGTIMGYLQSHRLHERVKNLKQFSDFLVNAESEINYSATISDSVCEIYGKDVNFLKPYFTAKEKGEDFPCAMHKITEQKGLDEIDKMILNQFSRGFGLTDLQGQSARLHQCEESCSRAITDAENDFKIKGKLFSMLGVLGGTALALLLC